MADVELFDFGNGGDRADIGDREAVAGMNGEPKAGAQCRRLRQRAQGRGVAGVVRIGAGMELDRHSAGVMRGAHHALVGIDEEAGADAGGVKSRDAGGHSLRVAEDVQSALGGDLGSLFRNETDLMRHQRDRDVDHLLGERHFQIEDGANRPGESLDVVVLDVAAVFAQVRGDAIGAGVFTQTCRFHRIGFTAAPRLPHGGDVVHVDVKPQSLHRLSVCLLLAFPRPVMVRRTGARVKKLAIAALLVMAVAGCRGRMGTGTTRAGGANSPREAIERFLGTAKAQDYEGMGLIFGSAKGPARATIQKAELQQREFIFMRCMRHDRYQIGGETQTATGDRVLGVQLWLKDLTASSNFTVVEGPNGRWYVQEFQPDPLQPICTSL